MNQPLLPSGLQDLLPPDAAREQGMITALLGSFAAFGYEQVTPPLVEFEETLLSGKGQAYAAQTFRLIDPESQKMLGVRADITTQVARIASTRMNHLHLPLRICYAGRVLRTKPQGLNPDRQLVQSGIEIVGVENVSAMTEVITVCLESLIALGCDAVVVDLTLAGLLDLIVGQDTALDEERKARITSAVKHKDASGLPDDLASRPLLLQLLALSGNAEDVLLALANLPLPPRAVQWRNEAAEMVNDLRAAFPALTLNFDPLESQGFEYQEGLSFSLFDAAQGREIGRGGGYAIPHAPDVLHACGATLYIRRLMEGGYLTLPPRQHVFLPFGTSEDEARKLRRDGYSTIRALHAGETPDSRCRLLHTGGEVRPIV